MPVTEGGLTMVIPPNCIATKFDGADHGLSHCMKAVDFVIETPGALLFIEFKDPDAGTVETRAAWTKELSNGRIDNELKTKFRDTWIYMHASGKVNKPINYLVLIALSNLSTEALSARTSSLKRQIPIEGPNGPWTNPLLAGCAVHNIESWNRNYQQLTIVRD